MSRTDAPLPQPIPRTVPVLLAFVAGFVDGCTFLGLFGLFVAQVTGSFVIAGAELVVHDESALIKIIAIPVFFAAAAATAAMVFLARRRGAALVLGLVIETLLLLGLLLTALLGTPFHDANVAGALIAALFGLSAMGVQSALVRLLLPGVASTNVMTSNTTQVAIDTVETALSWLAARRTPEDAEAAKHHAVARERLLNLVPLGFGFFAGTIAGAVGYAFAGFWCLVIAAAVMLGLIAWAMRRAREQA